MLLKSHDHVFRWSYASFGDELQYSLQKFFSVRFREEPSDVEHSIIKILDT